MEVASSSLYFTDACWPLLSTLKYMGPHEQLMKLLP